MVSRFSFLVEKRFSKLEITRNKKLNYLLRLFIVLVYQRKQGKGQKGGEDPGEDGPPTDQDRAQERAATEGKEGGVCSRPAEEHALVVFSKPRLA